jgi:hypothetical protein
VGFRKPGAPHVLAFLLFQSASEARRGSNWVGRAVVPAVHGPPREVTYAPDLQRRTTLGRRADRVPHGSRRPAGVNPFGPYQGRGFFAGLLRCGSESCFRSDEGCFKTGRLHPSAVLHLPGLQAWSIREAVLIGARMESRDFGLRETDASADIPDCGFRLVFSYAAVPFTVCSSAWCLVASSVW